MKPEHKAKLDEQHTSIKPSSGEPDPPSQLLSTGIYWIRTSVRAETVHSESRAAAHVNERESSRSRSS